jgi:hypothetical protein
MANLLNLLHAFMGVLLSASLLSGACQAFDKWEDFVTWDAEVHGGSGLSLKTSMNNDLSINGTEVFKTTITNLSAMGTDEVKLKSISKLITYEGDHVSAIKSTIDQNYKLPDDFALLLSQSHEITGFPDDPDANLSSKMDIIDPTTGDTLITFSSNKNDDEVDAIINQALANMGFTLTIDDFRSLQGNSQYSVERYDSSGGISCAWGEIKNLPVTLNEG